MTKLESSSFEKFDSGEYPKLYLLDFGLRMRRTSSNCATQSLDKDYYYSEDIESRASSGSINGGCTHPAYFSFVIGSSLTPISIVPGSHKHVFYTHEELKKLGKREKLRLLHVPTYSVLLVRRDILHSGAGSRECMDKICEHLLMYID